MADPLAAISTGVQAYEFWQWVDQVKGDVRRGGTFDQEHRRLLAQIWSMISSCARLLQANNVVHQALQDNLNNLKSRLWEIRTDLKAIPNNSLQRTFNYSDTREILEKAKQELDVCNKLFQQISSENHMLSQARLKDDLLADLRMMRQETPLGMNPTPSDQFDSLPVTVRCLGSSMATMQTFTLEPDSIGSDLISEIIDRDDSLEDSPIYLFKAIDRHHELTQNGRFWTGFDKKKPIREIATEAGERPWRVEYAERNDAALLLVEGNIVQEHVILVPLPIVPPPGGLKYTVLATLQQTTDLEIGDMWDLVRGQKINEDYLFQSLEHARRQSNFLVKFRCVESC